MFAIRQAQPGEYELVRDFYYKLAILPTYSRKGYGEAMVRYVIDHGRASGQKAIRLDVLDYNLPAERLYQKLDFQLRGEQDMYYEDTGWTGFRLYEYLL